MTDITSRIAGFEISQDDYDLTLTVLGQFGVDTHDPRLVPSYKHVSTMLNPNAVKYLGMHVVRGDQPELTFDISSVPNNHSSLRRTIDLFNRGEKIIDPSLDSDGVIPAIALHDRSRPDDRRLPANNLGAKGLLYINMSSLEQQKLLAKEQLAARAQDLEVDGMTLSEFLVIQGKCREAGLPMLGGSTITRFIDNLGRALGVFTNYDGQELTAWVQSSQRSTICGVRRVAKSLATIDSRES